MTARVRSVVLAALAVLCALVALAPPALAVPTRELVARARDAGAHGDWNTSARALEEIVAAGIDSSDVLYDLGTAYAQAGRYGEAIWRLEQVSRRSLFAGDAQQNLRAARLRLAHRDALRGGRAVVETAPPFWTSVGELLPLEWAVALALLAELLAIGCFFLVRTRRAGELARVGGAAGLLVFTLVALFGLGVVLAQRATPPAGIVLRDGLHLLRAPTADAIPDALIREGERVEILGREGAFARVRTPTGTSGWLATSAVGSLAE